MLPLMVAGVCPCRPLSRTWLFLEGGQHVGGVFSTVTGGELTFEDACCSTVQEKNIAPFHYRLRTTNWWQGLSYGRDHVSPDLTGYWTGTELRGDRGSCNFGRFGQTSGITGLDLVPHRRALAVSDGY
jgi:hypothetical protein